uniref:Ribonuclease P/MRP 25 subunit-like n=1 Tax=Gouania willdenowi TaxID=441366 RepID=A0A8C5FZT8_GOUWI
MENYSRVRTVERPSVCPFPDLPPDTPHVRVKDGSKIRNLLPFALSRMGAGAGPAAEGAEPTLRQVVVMASGKGVAKAVTVAELLKRRLKGLHQLTRLLYVTVDDVWEPRSPDAGLESLTVSRSLPAVWILLSAEPLDPDQPGYQGPGVPYLGVRRHWAGGTQNIL